MTKITMKAPDGRFGQVACSASGQNSYIDENGQVTVDQRDVPDLMRAGFSLLGEPAFTPEPTPSTFSQEPANEPDHAEKPAGESEVEGTTASSSEK